MKHFMRIPLLLALAVTWGCSGESATPAEGPAESATPPATETTVARPEVRYYLIADT